MTPLVYLVMFGWIPFVFYLFMRFPPQRAVITSFIIAWLFLPQAKFPLPGLPDYTKMSATCYGILLATVVYDAARLTSFRFGWLDIPMLIWCLCPIPSSLTNDLGLYDGVSSALAQTVAWGLPYFLGRLYLSNLEGLRQLAIGIFAGGVAYIPFCLVENFTGPLLHLKVYGFNAFNDWSQARRYGGWRPVVFMNHGLMVGVWMMAATLIGIWLWKTGTLKKLWNIPINRLVYALIVTFILARSTGAYVLLLLGVLFLFTAKWFRTALPVLILIIGISSYLYLGVTGTFTSEQTIAGLSQVFSEDRVASLAFRFKNEEVLGAKARERMMFGWGGYGRALIYDQNGKQLTIPDSLWIVTFGNRGLLGVICITAVLLLPVFCFLTFRYRANLWSHPKVAPAAVLAVILSLYMLDCVLNAMVNPMFSLTCGGISGLAMATETPKTTSSRSSGVKRALPKQRQQQSP